MQKKAMAALILFAILGVILFSAASPDSTLPASELEASGSLEEILLFEGTEDAMWLVTGGETPHLFRIAGGEQEHVTVTAADMALLCDGDIYLYDAYSWMLTLQRYDGGTLEYEDNLDTYWIADNVTHLALDSEKNIYAVIGGNTLKSNSGERSFTSIQFLAVDELDRLVFWADDQLYVDDVSYDCPDIPVKLLPGGLLVDTDGRVSQITGEGLKVLFQSDNLKAGHACSGDGEGGVLVADGGTLYRYTATGTQLASAHLDGPVLALCPYGAIIQKDDKLFYTVFGEALTPAASSSPESSEGPDVNLSSEPEPSPEPPLVYDYEHDFIIMKAGFTAKELREIYGVDGLEIFDAKGSPVGQERRLATGMTVNNQPAESETAYRWTIVILGDCDGDGMVSAKDVKKALDFCLSGCDPADPYARAADLTNDGAVTTEDTVLLSDLVE